MKKRNPRRTDEEWINLIQECRSSGLSDKGWCEEHHIHTSNFYYHIRRLRKKACRIPAPVNSPFSKNFDKDGFVLLQKRLDGNGRFQWPRNASEARLLTRQEFRCMEGLAIDQPKAIRAGGKKKDF